MANNNLVYKHRQIGYTILGVFIAVILLMSWIAVFVGWSPVVILPLILIAFIGYIFSSLTVEVTAEELTWYFGPGLWKLKLPRKNISDALPVRNKLWWGYGIRLTPRGVLYNVHGLDAVEVITEDGKVRRIGTNEPETLAGVLNSY